MIDGKNPFDCCETKDKESGCDNCVLYTIVTHGECQNDKCFCNYECGCLLSLDDTCKASTCYENDLANHDCSECVQYGEWNFGMTYCRKDNHEIGRWDSACEDFKEREV